MSRLNVSAHGTFLTIGIVAVMVALLATCPIQATAQQATVYSSNRDARYSLLSEQQYCGSIGGGLAADTTDVVHTMLIQTLRSAKPRGEYFAYLDATTAGSANCPAPSSQTASLDCVWTWRSTATGVSSALPFYMGNLRPPTAAHPVGLSGSASLNNMPTFWGSIDGAQYFPSEQYQQYLLLVSVSTFDGVWADNAPSGGFSYTGATNSGRDSFYSLCRYTQTTGTPVVTTRNPTTRNPTTNNPTTNNPTTSRPTTTSSEPPLPSEHTSSSSTTGQDSTGSGSGSNTHTSDMPTVPVTNDPNATVAKEKNGLSTGAIIGIAVGCVAFGVLVFGVILAICCCRRKKQKEQRTAAAAAAAESPLSRSASSVSTLSSRKDSGNQLPRKGSIASFDSAGSASSSKSTRSSASSKSFRSAAVVSIRAAAPLTAFEAKSPKKPSPPSATATNPLSAPPAPPKPAPAPLLSQSPAPSADTVSNDSADSNGRRRRSLAEANASNPLQLVSVEALRESISSRSSASQTSSNVSSNSSRTSRRQ